MRTLELSQIKQARLAGVDKLTEEHWQFFRDTIKASDEVISELLFPPNKKVINITQAKQGGFHFEPLANHLRRNLMSRITHEVFDGVSEMSTQTDIALVTIGRWASTGCGDKKAIPELLATILGDVSYHDINWRMSSAEFSEHLAKITETRSPNEIGAYINCSFQTVNNWRHTPPTVYTRHMILHFLTKVISGQIPPVMTLGTTEDVKNFTFADIETDEDW